MLYISLTKGKCTSHQHITNKQDHDAFITGNQAHLRTPSRGFPASPECTLIKVWRIGVLVSAQTIYGIVIIRLQSWSNYKEYTTVFTLCKMTWILLLSTLPSSYSVADNVLQLLTQPHTRCSSSVLLDGLIDGSWNWIPQYVKHWWSPTNRSDLQAIFPH